MTSTEQTSAPQLGAPPALVAGACSPHQPAAAAVATTTHRLLIIACTATKRQDVRLLPAIDRYDGPAFRVLRSWLRRRPAGRARLDVAILSAELGLIPAIQPIPTYDRRMTAARASELRGQARAALAQLLAVRRYASIYLSAGKAYRAALGDLSDLTGASAVCAAPAGAGIGEQLGALRRWLEEDTAPDTH